MSSCKMLFIFLVVCSASLSAVAEIPETPSFQQYSHLLKRSPFKVKVNKMIEKVNKPKIRQDYYLRGVTKLENGWMAVIVNRLKPNESIIVKQGVSNSLDVKLLDVIQNKEDYKLTLAKLKVGSQEMTIGYNKAELKKALRLQPAPANSNQKLDKSQRGSSNQTSTNTNKKKTQPNKSGKSVLKP